MPRKKILPDQKTKRINIKIMEEINRKKKQENKGKKKKGVMFNVNTRKT